MYIQCNDREGQTVRHCRGGLISSLPDQSPNIHMLALAESFSTHQIGCAMKISCYSNCRGLHITVGVYQISSDLIS